jgi:hypothetical protein
LDFCSKFTGFSDILSHVLVDAAGAVTSRRKFKFVADANGAYKKTIGLLIQYSRAVFITSGSINQTLIEILTEKQCQVSKSIKLNCTCSITNVQLEAFVLSQVAICRSLDDLQHLMMHLEFGFRVAVLMTISHEKVLEFSLAHLNELRSGRWSTHKNIR